MLHWRLDGQLQHRWDTFPCNFQLDKKRNVWEMVDLNSHLHQNFNNHCLYSTNSVHNRSRKSILLPAVSVSMACASSYHLTTSQNCILPERPRPCNFWTESECHFVWEGWEPSSICKHFPLVNCAQFLQNRVHNLLRWLFSWRPPSPFVMIFSGNAGCLRSGIASSQTFQLVGVYWLEVLNFKYWCIICLCDFNYFRLGP